MTLTKIQLLYFKERFIGKDYPGRATMERFSTKLRKLGLDEVSIGLGPDKQFFQALVASVGLNENLNPARNQPVARN